MKYVFRIELHIMVFYVVLKCLGLKKKTKRGRRWCPMGSAGRGEGTVG